ncbi:MAG: hypothetical protein L3J44_07455, partial [Campylobacteraceae bacterium]|nr:hypothetical protein [Campylobacteraceae bacterium]
NIEIELDNGDIIIVDFDYTPSENPLLNKAYAIKTPGSKSSFSVNTSYKVYLHYIYSGTKMWQVGTIMFKSEQDMTKYINYVKPQP